jgi:hypothetical protein
MKFVYILCKNNRNVSNSCLRYFRGRKECVSYTRLRWNSEAGEVEESGKSGEQKLMTNQQSAELTERCVRSLYDPAVLAAPLPASVQPNSQWKTWVFDQRMHFVPLPRLVIPVPFFLLGRAAIRKRFVPWRQSFAAQYSKRGTPYLPTVSVTATRSKAAETCRVGNSKLHQPAIPGEWVRKITNWRPTAALSGHAEVLVRIITVRSVPIARRSTASVISS